jgi:peptidyl-prolyl cis-trans isomerase A (cyclophilin A)
MVSISLRSFLILPLVCCTLCFPARMEAAQVCEVNYNPEILRDPCQFRQHAPDAFALSFETNYGSFVAACERQRAPLWVDRVWNLARFGYYNDNYFFRVLPNFVVQFGTAGDPSISNVYNWSTTMSDCAILNPQPPDMPYCLLADNNSSCTNGLSNTFGTLSMSTSYNYTDAYPKGVTWNATAELFINLGNNARLDENLFVPICTITNMDETVLKFPSFGECSDVGGTGPSLGRLYEEGNSYIEADNDWNATMAKTLRVDVCASE